MKDTYFVLCVLFLVVAIVSCVAWQFGPKPEWTPYMDRINQHDGYGGGSGLRKITAPITSRSRGVEPNSIMEGVAKDTHAYPDPLEDAEDRRHGEEARDDPMFTPLSQLQAPKP